MRVLNPGDLCERGDDRGGVPGGVCGHDASVIWTGDGGALAVTRDYMQEKWCRCCSVRAQLVYAREMASRVGALELELAELARSCRKRTSKRTRTPAVG